MPQHSHRVSVLGAVLVSVLLLPVADVGVTTADPACPEPPPTVGELADLAAQGGPLQERFPTNYSQINEQGLACYGGQTLTLRAFVAQPEGLGGATAYTIEPTWLFAHRLFIHETSDLIPGTAFADNLGVTVAVPPKLGAVWRRFDQRWVRLAGRFDDPAAQSCVASTVEGYPEADTPSPADAIEICRSFFVLTRIDAIATDPTPSVPATDAAEPGRTESPGALAPLAALVVASGLMAAMLWRRTTRRRA